jgi:glycosyltransferase involved in cell wall biosynthesis
MQDHTITVTVLIPAYNEARTIVEVLRRVNAQHIPGVALEILVVDDGSSDGTTAELDKRPELYSRLIKRAKNGGKGAAVRDGLLAASGEYVLFQDADLEYDPADYQVLFAPMLSRNADVVVGSRLSGSPITRVHYFWHRVGNQALTLLFNLTNNTTFTDIYSCYVLFRRSLIDPQALGSSGWEQQAELLSKLARNADSMYEVPISYYGRAYDEGKKIRAIHALSVARTIVRERLLPSRTR